jgi:rubrerythrin
MRPPNSKFNTEGNTERDYERDESVPRVSHVWRCVECQHQHIQDKKPKGCELCGYWELEIYV